MAPGARKKRGRKAPHSARKPDIEQRNETIRLVNDALENQQVSLGMPLATGYAGRVPRLCSWLGWEVAEAQYCVSKDLKAYLKGQKAGVSDYQVDLDDNGRVVRCLTP